VSYETGSAFVKVTNHDLSNICPEHPIQTAQKSASACPVQPGSGCRAGGGGLVAPFDVNLKGWRLLPRSSCDFPQQPSCLP
jgi:hypothetical protein